MRDRRHVETHHATFAGLGPDLAGRCLRIGCTCPNFIDATESRDWDLAKPRPAERRQQFGHSAGRQQRASDRTGG
jgi:hypothetical protein